MALDLDLHEWNWAGGLDDIWDHVDEIMFFDKRYNRCWHFGADARQLWKEMDCAAAG